VTNDSINLANPFGHGWVDLRVEDHAGLSVLRIEQGDQTIHWPAPIAADLVDGIVQLLPNAGPEEPQPAIWYLGSPYSHEDLGVREERHRYVCQAAARLFESGIYTYSPIAHTVAINELGGLNEAAFEFWRAFDLGMVDRLTGLMVLMLPGWRESVGLTAEIAHARATGKPVLWVEPVIDARTGRLTGCQLHEDEPVAEDEDEDPQCLTCEDERWLPNDEAESEADPVWKPCPDCNPKGAIPCPYVFEEVEA